MRALLAETAGWKERYENALRAVLAFADRVYGPNTLAFRPQWRALDRSLIIATIYPLAIFLTGWTFGGSGILGVPGAGLRLLPDLPMLARPLFLAGIAASVLAFVYLPRLPLLKRADAWLLARTGETAKPDAIGTISIFAVSALWLGSALLVSRYIYIMPIILPLYLLVLMIFGASMSGFSFLALYFVVALLNYLFLKFEPSGLVLGLLVFAALPALNAVFDWLSVNATRFLLAESLRAPASAGPLARLRPAALLALDLAVALVCLSGLAFALGFLLEAANAVKIRLDGIPIQWVSTVAAATHAPFTEGFLYTGMLITTLVPTLVHLVFGLLAILGIGRATAPALAARITDDMSPGDKQAVAGYCARCGWRNGTGVLLAAGLSLSLMAMIFRWGFATTDETGKELPHPVAAYFVRITLCGASLIRGSCPLASGRIDPMPIRVPAPAPAVPPVIRL